MWANMGVWQLADKYTYRGNLSQNLRDLCNNNGTISQACRGMGISKQQFNRYLMGESVPNKATTAKICAYFKIDEYALFADTQNINMSKHENLHDLLDLQGSADILDNITGGPVPSIEAGLYTAYIVLSKDLSEIACSTVAIEILDNIASFRRITNFSEPASSSWHFVKGDHTGLVVERAHWIYFLGFAERGKSEPSMLAVQWLQIPNHLLSGTAFVGTETGPKPFPVVMEPMPFGTTLRSALKQSKVRPIDSPEISAQVKSVIKNQFHL